MLTICYSPHKFLFTLLLAAAVPVVGMAQRGTSRHGNTAKTTDRSEAVLQRASALLDTLSMRSRLLPDADSPASADPLYVSLSGRPALYPGMLGRTFSLPDTAQTALPGFYSTLAQAVTAMDGVVLTACLEKPEYAVELPRGGTAPRPPKPLAPQDRLLTDRYNKRETPSVPQLPMFGEGDLGIVVRKPNFWKFSGTYSLQFTQNHVSENWYKGGESHNALLASTVMELNFNNQRKLTFDNKLEMKLGFQTSHNDEEHKYKTNSDLLRLTNKLGVRAVKHWYYTVMLQSWTQFYKGYKANDKKVYSDFMSPFESLLSLGMDYQQTTKNNKFKISATLSPLALKFKYVGRPSLISSFGLDEGKHTLWEYGSNVTVNYTWNIVKNISWTGRFYYFTDYSKTQIEWENTFNLSINRYLSAKLFLYPRFDDSRQRSEGQSNFEFNELLSLGLNVSI